MTVKQQTSQLRKLQMEAGARQAKLNEPLHIKTCLLYYGEGSKGRNTFEMVNCDFNIIILAQKFIHHYFPQLKPRIRIRINCYPTPDNSVEDIENYWSQLLGISREQFIKTIDRSKYYKKPKQLKFKNGICSLRVNSTELVSHVKGAINQYIEAPIFSADDTKSGSY